MTEGEVKQGKLHCWFCHDLIGYTPVPVLLTGIVEHQPFTPDGLVYKECQTCGWWHRWEIVPKEAA